MEKSLSIDSLTTYNATRQFYILIDINTYSRGEQGKYFLKTYTFLIRQ